MQEKQTDNPGWTMDVPEKDPLEPYYPSLAGNLYHHVDFTSAGMGYAFHCVNGGLSGIRKTEGKQDE